MASMCGAWGLKTLGRSRLTLPSLMRFPLLLLAVGLTVSKFFAVAVALALLAACSGMSGPSWAPYDPDWSWHQDAARKGVL